MGATVQYNNISIPIPLFTHGQGALTAIGDAANWLAARFSGEATSGNCGQF